MKTFTIPDDEQRRIAKWLRTEVYPDVIAKQQKHPDLQRNSVAVDCWQQGSPYEGAIGGGLTYEFTPTSIGEVRKVRYPGDYTLDLTDYDSW